MSPRQLSGRLIWNIIVITIAVGIGAYGPLTRAIERRLNRPTAETLWLYTVHSAAPVRSGQDSIAQSYPAFLDLSSAKSLIGVAAYDSSPRDLTIGSAPNAHLVKGLAVSNDYFRVLRIPLMLGRAFVPADDLPGAGPIVVVSRDFWQRELGGAPTAIGSTIDFGIGPHTVVGVAIPSFMSADFPLVDLWLPVSQYGTATRGPGWQLSRDRPWLKVVVRLAPGVDQAAAEAELTTLLGQSGASVALAQLERGKPLPR